VYADIQQTAGSAPSTLKLRITKVLRGWLSNFMTRFSPVIEFKKLTEQSIQYCLINDWLSLDKENLSLKFIAQNERSFKTQKSAINLGKLFSGESIVEVYRVLGVKP
jgi:hypothetical protein